MKMQTIALAALVVITAYLTGCSSNQAEVKNMEQLYAENGVPVKTRVVSATGFNTEQEFTAALTGVKESSAYARVADKVDKIFGEVGEYVEKDAVVLTFPTDNPSANYYQSKVAYENAQASFQRMESYFESGGLSRQDYDNAKASFEVARANWDAVRQSVMVKAPISGIITRVNVQETDNVEKEDELFAIAQIDHMKAKIWVPEKNINSFKVGLKATAVWNGITLKGEVIQVDMSVNRQRQAFGVVIEFENPDQKVMAGVTATIRVETYTSGNAIVIDRKDLIKTGDDNFVFVAADGVAHKRPVDLGHAEGLDIEIINGLNAGEELIVEGQLHLDEGTKIRIVDASQENTTSGDRP